MSILQTPTKTTISTPAAYLYHTTFSNHETTGDFYIYSVGLQSKIDLTQPTGEVNILLLSFIRSGHYLYCLWLNHPASQTTPQLASFSLALLL